MSQIKSFTEAKRRLDALRQAVDATVTDFTKFLDLADQAISAVNLLKGEYSNVEIVEEQPIDVAPPATWADRVIELFKLRAGEPAMQRDIVKMYEASKWPQPENAKALYSNIAGAFNYLTNKKKLLIKTDRGYQLNAGE